jgi:Ca-activated chloride channel family protein
MPLLLASFRKGAVFILVLAPTLLTPSPTEASIWQDLWYTADQQGQNALQKGDAASAQLLFEDPEWQAGAAYKNGDYDAAAELYKQGKNADDYYNLGNAMARLGKLDGAIKAYDQALSIDPNMQDATANRALVEQLKQQQSQNNGQQEQSENSKSEDSQQQNSSEDSQSEENQQQSEEKAEQEKQAEQDSTEQQNQSEAEKQQNQQQTEEDKESAEQELSEMQKSEQEKLEEQQQQELQQWLRRVPDDPGGLLRQKFRYQSQQRASEQRRPPPPNQQERW